MYLEAAFGGRVAPQGNAADIRQQFAGLFDGHFTGLSSALGRIARSVPYRIYCPVNATSTGPLPIGVYMHGGGYILGGLESEDILCRAFSEQTNSIPVSVDYRLAPEHKHPTQLQDSLAVFEWAYANALSLGGERNRIFSIGTSAAVREIILGRSNLPAESLSGVIAISPVTVHLDNAPIEYHAIHKSYTEFSEGEPVLTRSTMARFFDDAGTAADNASSFMLLDKESLSRFPPVYISTTECDPLRHDGRALASALQNVGVDIREELYEGLPHCFWFFNSLPEWQSFIKNTVAAIQWILEEKAWSWY
ncbi:Versiconal hemiacetal acetate esterase [Talaromyces pinophilus]|nr:Versiconal hemiacetal acetate esterase [Talaromyces pinophilus]